MSIRLSAVAVLLCALHLGTAQAQTNMPRVTSVRHTNGGFRLDWTGSGTNGVAVQRRAGLGSGTWSNIASNNIAGTHTDTNPPVGAGLYRLVMTTSSWAPTNMALIPSGSFSMGNALSASGDGSADELPVHTVNMSAFYMDKYEVTKALWDEVRAWGLTNGYTDLPVGDGKAANHPVWRVNWYAAVKWSNARSQKEGLAPCYTASSAVYKTGTNRAVVLNMGASGYRLPTEAEWEKAARGGLSGKRFPWGDTITHSEANYYSISSWSYDVSPTRYHHPTYNDGVRPYSSPVGSFAPNGYGLYDMAGNIFEWCWDEYWSGYYTSSPSSDPLGPSFPLSTGDRVVRGGNWTDDALSSRAAFRDYDHADIPVRYTPLGFRCVRSPVP